MGERSIMGWIKGIVMSRYLKSIIRYLLVAFIVYLNKSVDVPYLADLVAFLEEHSERLIEVITVAILGFVGSWSFLKNQQNAKVEKQVHREVK
jgi:hypothetical protein